MWEENPPPFEWNASAKTVLNHGIDYALINSQTSSASYSTSSPQPSNLITQLTRKTFRIFLFEMANDSRMANFQSYTFSSITFVIKRIVVTAILVFIINHFWTWSNFRTSFLFDSKWKCLRNIPPKFPASIYINLYLDRWRSIKSIDSNPKILERSGKRSWKHECEFSFLRKE